jgi:hypothetical protein
MAFLAALLPAILGGASMIGQNIENKAANKNNDNQQAAAVQNAQAASQAAFQRLQQFLAQNPSPANGVVPGRPGGLTMNSGAIAQGGPQNAGATLQGGQQGPPHFNGLPMPMRPGMRPPMTGAPVMPGPPRVGVNSGTAAQAPTAPPPQQTNPVTGAPLHQMLMKIMQQGQGAANGAAAGVAA